MQVFIGNLVHSLGYEKMELLLSQALGVDEEGTIAFIKPADQFVKKETDKVTILEPHQFLCPGFIDTHAHAPQYPNCGIFGDSTLLEWLTKYTFPLESQFANTEMAALVYPRVVERQLSNGTTTASYYGTVHVPSTVKLAEYCLSKGQRALVGRVCMQRFCPESLQDFSIDSDLQFIKEIRELDPTGCMVKPVITPRFAPSCEFDTLCKLGDLAHSEDLPIQTHVSENVQEIDWVRDLFPNASSYTDIYDRAKLLKHDTVLAHGIHFHPKELDLIRDRKAGISHCPNSNASIASGIAQVKQYLKLGLKVGLGSDISGGSTPSILKNARLALLMSRLLSQRDNGNLEHVLSVDNVLFLATLGGAQVLNLDDNIGNFAEGKKFDAQLVDVLARDSVIDVFESVLPKDEEERLLNLIQKWVYIGDDRNTTKVWVNGKLVHSRNRL